MRRRRRRKRSPSKIAQELTRAELLIARIDAGRSKLSPEDRVRAASLLRQYLRRHELTGPQWNLMKKLDRAIADAPKRRADEILDRELLGSDLFHL